MMDNGMMLAIFNEEKEKSKMGSFHENMMEYQLQMKKGIMQKAYRGLMEYIMDLKTHFKNKYPEYIIPGNIYFGYMDMTYFSVIPEALKQRNLKIAIVFIHESCRFEAWLAGYNKNIQEKYWNLIRENNWNKYSIVPSIKGADSIIEHALIDKPDFSDLNTLTNQIDREVSRFIFDIESFLSDHED
jgi:hypothetical protein